MHCPKSQPSQNSQWVWSLQHPIFLHTPKHNGQTQYCPANPMQYHHIWLRRPWSRCYHRMERQMKQIRKRVEKLVKLKRKLRQTHQLNWQGNAVGGLWGVHRCMQQHLLKFFWTGDQWVVCWCVIPAHCVLLQEGLFYTILDGLVELGGTYWAMWVFTVC